MKKLLILLPKDIYEEVRKIAYETHTSMAEIVRQALISMINKGGKNEEYSQNN